MLSGLTGNVNKEHALIYLIARKRGYAHQIAWSSSSTRKYEFNTQYAMRDELRFLLEKALSLYPRVLRSELLVTRKRTRCDG